METNRKLINRLRRLPFLFWVSLAGAFFVAMMWAIGPAVLNLIEHAVTGGR